MTTAPFKSFNWMRMVADARGVTILRRLILLRLCMYRNKEGVCDPTYDAVAKKLGVDRASIIRAVDDGVKRGWLAPPTSRGRTSNKFEFTFPLKQSHQSDGGEPSTVAPEQPLKPSTVAPEQPLNRRTRATVEAPTVAAVQANGRSPAIQRSHPCDPKGIRERDKRTG